MNNWMKWGLAATLIGIVIEYLTMGYFQFFRLAPKLEQAVGILLGGAYFPGERLFLILALYFISGAIIQKILSKYLSRRG